ncbi:hypothetical protein GCM10028868_39120 [Virgibacillus kimchii]
MCVLFDAYIIKVFNSEEVYYCETVEHVKETIEKFTAHKSEIKEKVRVFETKQEIDLDEI